MPSSSRLLLHAIFKSLTSRHLQVGPSILSICSLQNHVFQFSCYEPGAYKSQKLKTFVNASFISLSTIRRSPESVARCPGPTSATPLMEWPRRTISVVACSAVWSFAHCTLGVSDRNSRPTTTIPYKFWMDITYVQQFLYFLSCTNCVTLSLLLHNKRIHGRFLA